MSTWTEAQPADVVEAAIEELRTKQPEAWLLFNGDKDPGHALWAHLAAGFADDMALSVAIGVVDDLSGPVGRAARLAGKSPYEAAHLLAARHEHPAGRFPFVSAQELVPAPIPEDVTI